jgi:Tfp pilus assembly protein PilF
MSAKILGENRAQRARKGARRNGRATLLLAVLLAVVTFVVFSRTIGHPFVNFDDQVYVSQNPHVQAGLSAQHLAWALTAHYAGTWQPTTWFSLMLDHQVYGLRPFGFHLTNLLLHIAGVVLLFLALVRMTGSPGRSAFVAGLFALHPQRVESVAWVTERKDVLSGFLWMLTLLAYVRYTEKPVPVRYALVLLFFALGLMAKPMLVSLPLVLVLLDYWPLRRFNVALELGGSSSHSGSSPRRTLTVGRLLLEKAPLLALAVVSSVLTVVAQQHAEAVVSLASLPVGTRLANAVVAFAGYVAKMVWPVHLAVIYPHPGQSVPAWEVLLALLALAAGSCAVWKWRRRGYLVTGWLWYLITLVPVIGIVQIGSAATADRFTYLTHIGLYLMVAWGAPDLLATRVPAFRRGDRFASQVLAVGAGSILLALSLGSWAQAGVWRDSLTLWTHAVRVTRDNYLAHANLAKTYYDLGRPAEAEQEYREALRINPGEPRYWTNLGAILGQAGRLSEAMDYHLKALELDPSLVEAYTNRALVLVRQQKLDAAVADYQRALALRPDDTDARFNLGLTLANLGRLDEAEVEFRRVLVLRPDFDRARTVLGKITTARRATDSG